MGADGCNKESGQWSPALGRRSESLVVGLLLFIGVGLKIGSLVTFRQSSPFVCDGALSSRARLIPELLSAWRGRARPRRPSSFALSSWL